MKTKWKKRIARIISNFGLSFVTPFTGSGIAQGLYSNTIRVEEMIATALIASVAYTALVVFQEVREFGNKK